MEKAVKVILYALIRVFITSLNEAKVENLKKKGNFKYLQVIIDTLLDMIS